MGEDELEELVKVWPRLYQNWLLLVRQHYDSLTFDEQAIVGRMQDDFWMIARRLGIESAAPFDPDKDEWTIEPETGTNDWRALK